VRRLPSLLAFFAGIVLVGCVQMIEPEPGWTSKVSAAEVVGALAGGALGGYLSAQFGAGRGTIAMTTLGVTAGVAFGKDLGRDLETANRLAAQQCVVPLMTTVCGPQTGQGPSKASSPPWDRQSTHVELFALTPRAPIPARRCRWTKI
jgi:hypothetical protein